MAFTHSLRTGVMPTLSVDGTFAAQTIRYLDSMDLQHQLHLLNIHSHAGAYPLHTCHYTSRCGLIVMSVGTTHNTQQMRSWRRWFPRMAR